MKQIDRKNWRLIAKPIKYGDAVYSNFDHEYALTEEQVKESSKYHQHSAIDYCGDVWYDTNVRKFYNQIMIYHEIVAIIEGDTLAKMYSDIVDVALTRRFEKLIASVQNGAKIEPILSEGRETVTEIVRKIKERKE